MKAIAIGLVVSVALIFLRPASQVAHADEGMAGVYCLDPIDFGIQRHEALRAGRDGMVWDGRWILNLDRSGTFTVITSMAPRIWRGTWAESANGVRLSTFLAVSRLHEDKGPKIEVAVKVSSERVGVLRVSKWIEEFPCALRFVKCKKACAPAVVDPRGEWVVRSPHGEVSLATIDSMGDYKIEVEGVAGRVYESGEWQCDGERLSLRGARDRAGAWDDLCVQNELALVGRGELWNRKSRWK